MQLKEIVKLVDHTILKQDSTWEQVRVILDEALKYGTASVCLQPSYVKQAKEYVGENLKICTVIGFPNGYNTTAVKCFETEEAVKNGADEIDMVINIGWLKDKKYDDILAEIKAIKKSCNGKLLKVIESRIADEKTPHTVVGEILSLDNGIEVACKTGSIYVTKVLPEGKSRMSAVDFIRGRAVSVKDVLS